MQTLLPKQRRGHSATLLVNLTCLMLVGGAIVLVAMAAPKGGDSKLSAIATKEIQALRVGDRVLARNPQLSANDREWSDPDPANWQRLRLSMEKDDGGVLTIERLRPVDWIDSVSAREGATIELDLPELGAEGPAQVLSISHCPSIRDGD